MIVLTPKAASAVKSAMLQAGKPDGGLRIMIDAGGCAGYKYFIGLEVEPEIDDAVIETGDVRVFIDARSRPLARGLKIDFIESAKGPGFTFDNPSAAGGCSCGRPLS